jgi:hypothetical protein
VRHAQALSRIVVCAALIASTIAPAADQAAAAPSETSVWRHHQTTFIYSGITALYTCDGLEEKVRVLLLYLGARADLKVHALGCSPGLDRPSRNALVSIDFYSLAAADPGATQTVKGQWVGFTVMPGRPIWMGDGECELMDQLKDLLTKSFSMRNLDYRTTCVTHQTTIADYSIKGEILEMKSEKPG